MNLDDPFELKYRLKHFGIGALTLDDAASLIARCLYCSGEIELSCDIESVSLRDAELGEALKEHIAFYRAKLLDAVDKGTLKTEFILRDLDEKVVEEAVRIDCYELDSWLQARGVVLGDLYTEDYLFEVVDMLDLVEKTASDLLAKQKNPELADSFTKMLKKEADKFDSFSLFLRVHELERQLAKYQEHPKEQTLTTRTRETLLKLILGMAVDAYGYDPKASRSPVPREIASCLELLNLHIDEDTVRKWLNEAKEAHKVSLTVAA